MERRRKQDTGEKKDIKEERIRQSGSPQYTWDLKDESERRWPCQRKLWKTKEGRGNFQAQVAFCLNSENKIITMSSYLGQTLQLTKAHGKVILWRDKALGGFFFFSFFCQFLPNTSVSLKLIGLTPTWSQPFVSLCRADLADFFSHFTIAKLNHSNRMENVPTPLENGYVCVSVWVREKEVKRVSAHPNVSCLQKKTDALCVHVHLCTNTVCV